MLDQVLATRYVTPLREGGSLPGLMEADDLGTYVVKYRGAGQGVRALAAEVISAGLARAVGLPVPDLVAVTLEPELAVAEPDQEVQDLLRASAGLNLGVDFLPGALDFDPVAFPVDPVLAGRIVWFDAAVGNVDRSARNPNLLVWGGRVWLIDHGATLSFHHRWATASAHDARHYDIDDHVLVGSAPDVAAADRELAAQLDGAVIAAAVAAVPDAWLAGDAGHDAPDADPDEVRAMYVARISARLAARDAWLPPMLDALSQRSGGPA